MKNIKPKISMTRHQVSC